MQPTLAPARGELTHPSGPGELVCGCRRVRPSFLSSSTRLVSRQGALNIIRCNYSRQGENTCQAFSGLTNSSCMCSSGPAGQGLHPLIPGSTPCGGSFFCIRSRRLAYHICLSTSGTKPVKELETAGTELFIFTVQRFPKRAAKERHTAVEYSV